MMREKSQLHIVVQFRAAVFLTVLTVLLGLPSWSLGQNENHSYQSFKSVYSPSQLNQILGGHDAVQEKIVSDKIAEMVMKKFKTLTPEQRQRLAELSKDFGDSSNTNNFADKRDALERAIQNDPELRETAEKLRRTFRKQNFNFDSTNRRAFENNIRQQVENRLQQEIQRRSNALENNSSTPFDFNNNPFSSDPTQPNNPNTNNPNINNSNTNNPNTNNPNSNNQNPFENNNSPNNNSPFNNSPENNSNPSSSPYEIDQQNSPHGGFSDNGQNNSNESNSSAPSQNSASGQNEASPKESIGHRFNRIVMNSFEKAMEKKVGSDNSGAPQSFERLMNKFVDSMAKSNPDLASNLNSGSNRIFQSFSNTIRNANNRSRMSMPKWNGFGGGRGGPAFGGGGGFSMPAIDVRSVVMFLLVVGMVICATVFALKKTALGELLGVRPAPAKEPPPPVVPNSFQDYEEIVTLIDRFTLWLFGKKASWWNSKIVSEEVAQKSPMYSQEFKAVMKIYDKARYADASEPVSSQMVHEIRTTLNQLKEATLAEKNQSPNSAYNLQSA